MSIKRALIRLSFPLLVITGLMPLIVSAGASGWLVQAREALAAGHSAQALLLVQRSLAEEPASPEAEAIIAAIESSLGEGAASTLRPPDSGLKADLRRTLSPHIWATLEAGQDSNINSGMEATSISIPLLGNRVLPLEGVESQLLTATPSSFVGSRFGLELSHTLTPRDRIWLSGEGAWRANIDQILYLPLRYSLATGVLHRSDRAEFGVSAFLDHQWLAYYQIVSTRGVAGDVGIPVSDALTLFANADVHEDRYPQFLEVRTEGQRLGIGVKGQLPGKGMPSFSLGLRQGPDRSPGSIHALDRDSLEVSLSAGWSPAEAQRLRGRVWANDVRYDEVSPAFLVRRRDQVRGAAAEWEFGVAKGWTLTPKVAVEESASNISLYDFSRQQWSIELKREW